MTGESSLGILLQQMKPVLNEGLYVFCSQVSIEENYREKIIGTFREQEGLTIIIDQATADQFQLPYQLICSWITLTVHSSLEAVGLTATFSTALSKEGISCNVVAAFYHDHIFVAQKDAKKAMEILQRFGRTDDDATNNS